MAIISTRGKHAKCADEPWRLANLEQNKFQLCFFYWQITHSHARSTYALDFNNKRLLNKCTSLLDPRHSDGALYFSSISINPNSAQISKYLGTRNDGIFSSDSRTQNWCVLIWYGFELSPTYGGGAANFLNMEVRFVDSETRHSRVPLYWSPTQIPVII